MAVIEIPGTEELERQANTELAQAQTYKITTPAQYQATGQELVRVKTLIKKAHELFDPICKATDEAHTQATTLRAKVVGPLSKAEWTYRDELGAWDSEQRRIALAEEARLRREAEEKAAEERRRLEAKAEKALFKGQDGKAESFLDQAAAVVTLAPVVVPQTVQVTGLKKTQFVRKALITDAARVPAYWAGVELRTINQSALNSLAKLSPDRPSTIPGVEFYDEPQIAASGR